MSVWSTRTLIPVLHQKAKRGTPHQAKQAVHCIHAIFNNKEVQLAQIFEVEDPFPKWLVCGMHIVLQIDNDLVYFYLFYLELLIIFSYVIFFFLRLSPPPQPLSRSLNAAVPEQLITPLVSLGHISMLAPDQFASPMKSIVANFIVKDLLMNDRVCGFERVNSCSLLFTVLQQCHWILFIKIQLWAKYTQFRKDCDWCAFMSPVGGKQEWEVVDHWWGSLTWGPS